MTDIKSLKQQIADGASLFAQTNCLAGCRGDCLHQPHGMVCQFNGFGRQNFIALRTNDAFCTGIQASGRCGYRRLARNMTEFGDGLDRCGLTAQVAEKTSLSGGGASRLLNGFVQRAGFVMLVGADGESERIWTKRFRSNIDLIST